MPKETDIECRGTGKGSGGSGCEELESHGGRVVRDTVEHGVFGGQVCKAEEGLEGSIGAELDTDFGLAGPVDGAVQELDNLGSQLHSSNSTDRGGGIVREVKFMGIGQGSQLEQLVGSERVIGIKGLVMNFGNINEVED